MKDYILTLEQYSRGQSCNLVSSPFLYRTASVLKPLTQEWPRPPAIKGLHRSGKANALTWIETPAPHTYRPAGMSVGMISSGMRMGHGMREPNCPPRPILGASRCGERATRGGG